MKRIARILFLTTVMILVILLGVELLTRLFLSSALEPVVPVQVGQYDAQLGWKLAPNATGVSDRTGRPVRYQINSHGWRDDETGYDKPPGTRRIVLLGDSRTFGYGVDYQAHYSKLVEGYFDDVEVINLGVSGYGVDQQLLALRLYGFAYQPDLVMVYVAHYGGHRHMHGHRFGEHKPYFNLENETLKLMNTPVPPPTTSEVIFSKLARYSLVFSALSTLGANSNPTELQETALNAQDEVFMDQLHTLGQAIIQAMHDDSAGAGAEFLLVTQIPELDRYAREHHIHSLDVSESLDNDLFSLCCGLVHLNEAGNGVLAWEIAKFIDKEHLLNDKSLTIDH